MRTIAITFAALSMVAGFGISTVCAEPYFSGNLGVAILDDSDLVDGPFTGEATFKNGVGLTGAIGGTLGDSGRVELEMSYRANKLDQITIDGIGTGDVAGKITTKALMGNIYHDFAAGENFSPFIGAGLGFANVEGNINGLASADDTVFAYQLALGGSFGSGESVNIDLQYRFFGTADPDLDGLEAEHNSHNFMIGIRQSF